MTVKTKPEKITDDQITEYQPLVKSIAYKFKNSGEPLEDLEQLGYIGLINALNLYNQDRGAKFETYATWLISGEIRHHIRDKHQTIKIPRWMLELNKRIDEFIIYYKKENNRFPNISEISDEFNLTEESIKEILKARDAVQIISLDRERRKYNSDNYPKLERIKSKTYQSFKLPMEDIITLKIAFSKLKKLQRKVIYYIFKKDLTQTKIARQLGLSQRQVSRIKKSALKSLKQELE
ncbi:sigma-70 family RNA polymerase sigma factor [Candidatus Atribacteria bacterium MT.SAG.1]|nr:sigma-70 family RNA polymerase sigma factor [Candidatus Atribacteria bacterium MT.SAG.1]